MLVVDVAGKNSTTAGTARSRGSGAGSIPRDVLTVSPPMLCSPQCARSRVWESGSNPICGCGSQTGIAGWGRNKTVVPEGAAGAPSRGRRTSSRPHPRHTPGRRSTGRSRMSHPERERLHWRGSTVKLAAIGHAVELGALSRHRHFFGVDVCSGARHVGVHQGEGNGGTSGTTAKIQYPLHIRLHIAGYPRDEVLQVMVHHPQIVPVKNLGVRVFQSARDRPFGLVPRIPDMVLQSSQLPVLFVLALSIEPCGMAFITFFLLIQLAHQRRNGQSMFVAGWDGPPAADSLFEFGFPL